MADCWQCGGGGMLCRSCGEPLEICDCPHSKPYDCPECDGWCDEEDEDG